MLKRPRPARRSRHSAELDELLRLANGLAHSGTLAEDRFWQDGLLKIVNEIIGDEDEETLTAALDALAKSDTQAWNELADVIEASAETRYFEHEGQPWVGLLFAAPVLSWSRYAIPSGPLGRELAQNLRVQLGAHVFARNVRVTMVDFLFSPDQLPEGYVNTTKLTETLLDHVMDNSTVTFDPRELPETRSFLSDTRYIVGLVAAPLGAPILRWHEEDGVMEEARQQWSKQGGGVLQPVFAGCAFEPLLPLVYFAAWREADRASRAYAVRATISFLQVALNVEARQLAAAIAPCHGRRLEEYRIGFSKVGDEQVINGVVWPLLDNEDEHTDCVGEIEALLRECGLTDIVSHDHHFPLDYCDDCGSPLYPNADGELLHSEAPEDTQEQPRHLH